MNFKVGDVLSNELIANNANHFFVVYLQSRFAFFIKKITLLNDSDLNDFDLNDFDLNSLNDSTKMGFDSKTNQVLKLYKIDVILIKIENLNEYEKIKLNKYNISETDAENFFYCVCGNNDCVFLSKQHHNYLFLKKINERIKIDGEFLFMGRDGKFVKTFEKKTIDSGKTEPDGHQGRGKVNLKKFVDNEYIIIYDDNDETKEEITLYGPDKDNNYTTEPSPTLLKKVFECVGKLCSIKNKVLPKGGSKTRKRRKSKKLHK